MKKYDNNNNHHFFTYEWKFHMRNAHFLVWTACLHMWLAFCHMWIRIFRTFETKHSTCWAKICTFTKRIGFFNMWIRIPSIQNPLHKKTTTVPKGRRWPANQEALKNVHLSLNFVIYIANGIKRDIRQWMTIIHRAFKAAAKLHDGWHKKYC